MSESQYQRAVSQSQSAEGPPANAPSMRPEYTEETRADGTAIKVHCSACSACWLGGWQDNPTQIAGRWVRLPKYDGGTFRFTNEKGHDYAYRCNCTAGELHRGLPQVPERVLSMSMRQGTPGRATMEAGK